jgi:hypothetical protein
MLTITSNEAADNPNKTVGKLRGILYRAQPNEGY